MFQLLIYLKGVRMKKPLSSFIALALTVMLCQSAFAFFELKKKSVPPEMVGSLSATGDDSDFEATPLPKDVEAPVVQVGASKLLKPKLYKVSNLPLETTLAIITPSKNWDIYDGSKNKDVLRKIVSVDYQGTWISCIEELAVNYGLRFLVNWPDRCIYVYNNQNYKKAVPNTLIADASNVLPSGDSSAKEDKTWKLAPGNLKEQIKAWCETQGCQLVWKTKNWRMSTRASFTSSFEDAIRFLTKAVRDQGVWIQAQYYPENQPPVLVIY